MKKTTCPLDCYDACSVEYIDGKLKGDISHPFTRGFLCPNLNSFLNQKRITKPRYKDREITLDEALEIFASKLKEYKDSENLYFKGSGNFGKMQDITSLFFSKYGFTFTDGSLCDGAGEFGVIEGRGVSLALPIDEIKKSDVIVVWGRNLSVTNSHLFDIVKEKKLIVIDPVKTLVAKRADLHLQIRPRSDFFLALLLARFVLIEEMEDREFIDNHTEEFDYYIDFLESFRINRLIKEVDLKVSQFTSALEMIRDKRVSFLVGVGVQKYIHGASVLRAIDSLAALLGLFMKEGSGVSYLGSSSFGFFDPFKNSSKRVAKPIVDFAKYDIVYIQGANPISQMPDTNRVLKALDRSKFVIYFGLYENESSKIADLVIPAKSFLEKDDVRFSYGSEYIGLMPKLVESDFGISEYELTKYLFDYFSFGTLKSEKEYIDEILESNSLKVDGIYSSQSYRDTPYIGGFYTDSKKFIFIDEVEDEEFEHEGSGKYFLITSKAKKSLNSQFNCDEYLYISPNNPFSNQKYLKAISNYGSYIFKVKVSDELRDDCVKIHSGTKGVNYLTPSLKSNYGESAVFQEVKIELQIYKK